MSLTIFLAQIFGPLFIVACLGMLMNRSVFERILQQMTSQQNSLVMFFIGCAVFTIGLFLVLVHNVWTNTYEVVLSIIAWGALIKGTLLLLFPDFFKKHIQKIVQSGFISMMLPIGIVLGLYVAWFGYFS